MHACTHDRKRTQQSGRRERHRSVFNFKMAHSTMLSTACPEKTRRKGERETEREREIGGGTGTSLFSVYLALWYSVSHNKALCGVSAYAGLTSCACQNEKTAKQRPRGSPPPLYLHLPASPPLRSFCDRARRTIGPTGEGRGASSPRPGPCETRRVSHFGLSNLRRELLFRTINFASREIRREYSKRMRAPLACDVPLLSVSPSFTPFRVRSRIHRAHLPAFPRKMIRTTGTRG